MHQVGRTRGLFTFLIYSCRFFFFFNDTATTEIYTLSLHDALPISWLRHPGAERAWTLRLGGCLRPDRKSTRLNSSHGYISYAVFCLKKKTNACFEDPLVSLPQQRYTHTHRMSDL